MEKNFRYIKKNKTFICENNIFKIEFSKPIVNGFSKFSSINLSTTNYFDEIETCNYTVKIFRSLNEQKWRMLNEINVNGFGIFHFQKLLKKILSQKKIACQKSIDESGNAFYSYVLNNKECDTNDFYEIRKIWKMDEGILFDVFIGEFIDNDVFNGIYFHNLNYQDILIWKKCVDDFIDYAISIQNQKIRSFNKLYSKCFHLKNGRIYYFNINQNKLENIFLENEETLTITEIHFSNKDTFFTTKHEDVIIEKINPKQIMLSDGGKIKTGRILDIKREFDVDDERLQFGVNGVANDFIYALSIEDRDDFINLSDEKLIEKYENVIVNRTYIGKLHPISMEKELFKEKVIQNIKKKLN